MTGRTFKRITIVLALLIPILAISCGDAGLSRAEVEEIARAELAAAPAPVPAGPGLTAAEVERTVQAAMESIPEPGPGLAMEEVEEVIRTAMSDIPEPGIKMEEVEEAIRTAMSDIPEPEPGLTAAEVERIVQAAIASIPEPEPGITMEEVEEAIRTAMADIPEPEAGPSAAEIREIARSVVASIPFKSAPADYTKFFVDNAISRYESEGLDATLAHYNREESVDGQWYVFIVDEDDKVIGHYNPHLIGLEVKPPLGIDAEGYNFGAPLLEATEEGKWVSYVFNNPASGGTGEEQAGAIQLKHAWAVRHDGLLFASGWYSTADEYTKFVVDDAIDRYRSKGLEATLEHYNSPENVDGEWYAFIADERGDIIAHHAPDRLGDSLDSLLGTEDFAPTTEGKWVNHEDINPASGELQPKHFWVVGHDGLVFGSGWHHDDDGSS
ncbi:MAG: hypothetical protein OXI16_09850 [Chloroflexota bacterium]|nr:hypothetical protein [Chloroflexota bacterium]